MRLQYLGHSCFRLISDIGTTIITDPYKSQMLGYAMPRVSSDVVTVSHHHGDHDCVDELYGQPSEVDCEVACAVDDVAIQSLACFHDDVKGAKRGKNLVFTFLIDGIRVAHMGDIGEKNQEIVDALQGTNVLLVPVGGKYTIDAQGAKWYVDNVKPQIVIPMHYKTENSGVEVATVDEFTDLFDKQQVTSFDFDFLQINDVPENTVPKVIVMKRFED